MVSMKKWCRKTRYITFSMNLKHSFLLIYETKESNWDKKTIFNMRGYYCKTIVITKFFCYFLFHKILLRSLLKLTQTNNLKDVRWTLWYTNSFQYSNNIIHWIWVQYFYQFLLKGIVKQNQNYWNTYNNRESWNQV
jgi:hypothetical protein